MKPTPSSVSLNPYLTEINQYMVRGYKYFRTVKQFHQIQPIQQTTISRFVRKLKTAKRLNKLTIQLDPSLEVHFYPKVINSLLKAHSRKVKFLNVSTLSSVFTGSHKSVIYCLKNLDSLSVYNKKAELKHLCFLRKLESLYLDLRSHQVHSNQLYSALRGLKHLKNIKLLVPPSSLESAVEMLNKLSVKFGQKFNVEIATENEGNYSAIPSLDPCLQKSIAKLKLRAINETSLLYGIFVKSTLAFPRLQNLKLEMNAPDLQLISYLTYLEDLKSLEKLSLYFTGDWCSKSSVLLIRNFKFPSALQYLKIWMPIALQSLITKNNALLDEGDQNEQMMSWRSYNLFEEEPLLMSFYQAIKCLNNLKTLSLKVQMLENFRSHYTNFFVSILKRLPGLISFAFHTNQLQSGQETQISECCDLALLLDSCAGLQSLEDIEIYMPNLLFQDATLSSDLINLKSFNIGISEIEGEEPIKFENISKSVKGFIRILTEKAPRVNSLVLDFVEVVDEEILNKRFSMIEKFKDLEFLCLKFLVKGCNMGTIRNIGRTLQSFRRLDAVALGFLESGGYITKIKTYLRYHKSVRDIFLVYNTHVWTGSDGEDGSFNSSEMEEESSEDSSYLDEDDELEGI